MIDLNQTGGTAFPIKEPLNTDCLGMTLRDYFAAKCLQGMLSNPEGPIQKSHQRGWDFCNCKPEDVANLSYALADAMLKARNK